jgi:serine protease Do
VDNQTDKEILKTDEPVHSVSSSPAHRSILVRPTTASRHSRRGASRKSRVAVLAAAFIVISIFSGAAGGYIESRSADNGSGTTISSSKKIVSSESQLISQIAKSVGPSVVSVNVSITSAPPPTTYGNIFGSADGGGAPQTAQAAGTGIIISDSGYILTNRHVVPVGTDSVSVTLSNGTELKDVKVVARTAPTDNLDVAFLKVGNTEGNKLKAATIGNSSNVEIGDNVVAIGNALGQFQNTVTSGIISGFGRSVQAGDSSGSSSTESLDNLIQTDAAINEGNSGGPLVNLNGQVIGINTAIAGNGAQNIGFTIPINDVRGLVNQVIATGSFKRTYLGVRYIPLSADVAKKNNLNSINGAFVAPNLGNGSSVIAGGPADQAGIKEGDVITAVEGTKISQTVSLTSLLGKYVPGDKINLTIERSGKDQQVQVTLGTLPNALP